MRSRTSSPNGFFVLWSLAVVTLLLLPPLGGVRADLLARGPTPPAAPLAESPPIRKANFVSLIPGNPGKQIALRITLADITLASQVNGQVRWVGAPQLYNNDSGHPQFWAAKDQCTPNYQDWSAIDVLHIFGPDIVSGSRFAVQAIEQGADENDEANYSPPLVLTTSDRGDIVGLWDGVEWTAPDGAVTEHDVAAQTRAMQGSATGPGRVRCQRAYNGVPNLVSSCGFSDTGAVGEAFAGLPLSPPTPLDCGQPAHFACGNNLIEPGEICDDGGTAAGDGCDARCLTEPNCGNQVLDPGERCDDGNALPGDGCDSTCQLEAACGNGRIEPDDEECDDGNTDPADGCDSTCRREARSAVLRIFPVPPAALPPPSYPPGTQLSGSTISMYESAYVWFEYVVSGWDPDLDQSPRLYAAQATISEAALQPTNGSALRFAQVTCDGDCDAVAGNGSICFGACQSIWHDSDHPDRPTGCPPWDLSHPYAPPYSMGYSCFGGGGFVDAGIDYYLSSAVLEIPPGAFGTVNLAPEPGLTSSFLLDTNHLPIPLATIEGATIHFDLRKNRYLVIRAPIDYGVGAPLAARIKLVSLPQFPASNGGVRWAGPVQTRSERPTSQGSFRYAALRCTPHVQNLENLGAIQVHGREVVPGSTYEVRYATAACIALGQESCMSSPITITTSKWGDVWLPFDAGQPNFIDVSAVVDEFLESPTSLTRSRVQLHGDDVDPSVNVNFLDISACVSAFMGQPYPHAGPGACP